MSASSSAEDRRDAQEPAAAEFGATPCGDLWSSQPIGGKVAAVRSGRIHLVHTGIPAGWEEPEVHTYLSEACAMRPPAGAMSIAAALPLDVQGCIEAVRLAQEELWSGAEELGTTLVAEVDDHVWVVSRGSHRLSIQCTTSDAVPERPPGISGDLRACRLVVTEGWRIEVTLKDSPDALWSVRWRPAPRPVVEAPPVAESETIAPPMPEPVPAASAPTAPIAPLMATLAGVLGARLRGLATTARQPEYRRFLYGAAMVAVLCLAFAIAPKRPLVAASTWIGDVAANRYRAHVTSVPPGAEILVDGRSSGAHTPATILLPAGPHRVTLTLGEFGETETAVEGGRGARVTGTATLLGRLAIGNADTSVTLYAQLDGRSIGTVPTVLDSVPAGRRRLSFQGRDVRPWTEEVKVVAGKRTAMVVRPERVPEYGHVLARSFRVGPQGIEDAPGALVHLDGRMIGSTPLSVQVTRGLHTVRLVAGSERSPVQLLRVEGGGELHATAEFGRSPEPEVAEEISGPASMAHPPLVRASLSATVPLRIGDVRLFVRRTGRDFDRVAMTLREGTLGTFGEVALPLAGAASGEEIQYFVVVETDEGEEFVSEMRRVRVLP